MIRFFRVCAIVCAAVLYLAATAAFLYAASIIHDPVEKAFCAALVLLFICPGFAFMGWGWRR
jgi:hypothetical protein